MLLENERFCLEASVMVTSIPTEAPVIPLADCAPHLIEKIRSNEAAYSLKNGQAIFRIVDFSLVDERYLTLLCMYADSEISDPSFSELETGKTRTEKKKDGEGIATTAHVMIDLTPVPECLDRCYNALIEEVPGINRTLLSSALTSLIKEATDFTFKSPKREEPYKCRPKISVNLNAGHNLNELLTKGWVTGFSAERHVADSLLDEAGELVIEKESIVIGTNKTRGTKALDVIKKAIFSIKEKDYSRLVVRYTDDNKKQQSLPMSTTVKRNEDIGERFFSESKKIILADTIQQCEDSLHTELVEKMREHISTLSKIE